MANGKSVVVPGDRGREVVTPERWKQVEAVLEQALELPEGERTDFVQRSSDGDEELRGEVQSLLDSHARAGSFIDQPSLFVGADEIDRDEATVASGQLIGAYRVVREIGRGGMGMVYLAERADEQYRKRVAIKVIKRGMDTDAVLGHFRNERQILASFDHPNIARLLDGGATEDGLPYFVMEYVEGLPIDAYCDTHAPSIAERLTLFRQVCAAVTYAHRHTVIHRDIKPSNILVTGDSESLRERGGTPRLLDFGIAKILQPGAGVEALATVTGLRLMTPEYASPEQVLGQPLTTATDVYSLGVVLYQLLTGEKPYRLKMRSREEISRAVIEQEPTRPSSTIAKRDGSSKSQIPNPKLLRGDLDNIVLMALRKEPERRYQSVEQFSEDIRRHLEARPVTARKDTVGYRAAKFVRRNRAATAGAVVVLLSLLAGIIATTWEAHRARVQEAAAKAEKMRAERRFNDVRKLAHSVLFDYHDAIKDLPGTTRVRERLVKDALVYLDSLAGEASGDPALQRELAAAYDRVGDVRGGAYTANLGDRAGAMDSYLKALRIRKAMVTANPYDMQSRHELAENQRRIGWQLVDTGEASRGLEHLRKAVALYAKLTAEQSENAELQEELAHACNQLGLALQNGGDWTSAIDQLRRALALREKLVANHPDNWEYRRRLSVTDQSIGRGLGLTGDLAGALEMIHKALLLQEALVAEDPTNATYRRNLSLSYTYDAQYRDLLGDKRGALESYRKSTGINEELLTADPANVTASGDLAYAFQRMGNLLAATGDNSQALLNYRKSLQMYEKISAKAPEDLTGRFYQAICWAAIGKTQAGLGEKALALEECGKAISILEKIAEEPKNAMHRSLKAEAFQYLGETYAALAAFKEVPSSEATHHWSAARDMFQRSLDIWQDMRSRGILAREDARQLGEVTGEIAKCNAALQK